jgi:hypothetical protein
MEYYRLILYNIRETPLQNVVYSEPYGNISPDIQEIKLIVHRSHNLMVAPDNDYTDEDITAILREVQGHGFNCEINGQLYVKEPLDDQTKESNSEKSLLEHTKVIKDDWNGMSVNIHYIGKDE